MAWPSKNPADYQGPVRQRALGEPPPPSGPFLARATRTWSKDPNAPRWGRQSWRRYAHIPLWQIWRVYTGLAFALLCGVLSAVGDNHGLVPSALFQALAVGSGSAFGIAYHRAQAPDA